MLTRQILTSGLFKIVIQIVTFLTTIFIARILGSEILGEFNFAISLVAILNVFFINSLSSANISLINKGEVDDSEAMSAFLTISAIIFLVYGFFLILYSYITYYTNNNDLFLVITFLYLTEIFGVIINGSGSFYTSKINSYKASFPETIRIILSKVFQISFIFIFENLLSLAIGFLIGTLITLPFLFKYFWPKIKLITPTKRNIKLYLKSTIEFMSFPLTKIVPQQLDRIFLEPIVLFSFIGYYTIGQKVGNAIELIAISVGVVLFPFFTKLSKKNDVKSALKILKKFILIYFNIIVYPLFLICFFSKELLFFIFGEEFISSTLVMQIYIITGMITILMMPFNNVCIGFGKLRKINIANIASFLLFLSLSSSLFFLKDLSSQNAINFMAIARLVPNILILAFFMFYTSKLLNKKFWNSFILFAVHTVLFFAVYNFFGPQQKIVSVSSFTILFFIINSFFGYKLNDFIKKTLDSYKTSTPVK